MSDRGPDAEHEATIAWSQPREWRRHPLGDSPYWVEEEVVLRHGPRALARLSFDQPLDDDVRSQYDGALMIQAQMTGNTSGARCHDIRWDPRPR